jgi:hypothetical protein
MSENIYDALEDCLAAIQRGEDIESCLARHPGLAADLRPLLAAAAEAESLVVHAVPAEVTRRGRARLLNQAAELRERAVSARTSPAVGFRFRRSLRLAVSVFAALLVAFMVGGVGLVFASSGSLPGDPLYRVKLSWEDFRLQWERDPQSRDALEHHFEQERVGEVDELIKEGRAEEVKFVGRVTGIFPDHILVSNINVLLTPQTEIDGQLVLDGLVEVEGSTQPDGSVAATEIKVLGSPSQLGSGDQDDGGDESGDNSGPGGDPGPTEGPEETEESGQDGGSFDLEGSLTSSGANRIALAGTTIILNDSTEIRGTLTEGATVRARGFIDSTGALIATRVEVISEGGGSDGGDDDSGSTPTPTSGSGDSGSGDSGGGDSGSGGGDDGSGGGGGDDHGGSQTPTPTPGG